MIWVGAVVERNEIRRGGGDNRIVLNIWREFEKKCTTKLIHINVLHVSEILFFTH